MSDAHEESDTPRAGVGNHLEQVAATLDRWFVACAGPFGSAGQKVARVVDSAVSSTRRKPKPTTSGRFELLTTEMADCVVVHDPSSDDDADPDHDTLAAGTVVQEPAGLLPLLRALAAVVNAHGPVAYRTLPDDPRFWPLIELLASLPAEREALLKNADVEEEGRAPCTHSG